MTRGHAIISIPVSAAFMPNVRWNMNGKATMANIWEEKDKTLVSTDKENTGMRNKSNGKIG